MKKLLVTGASGFLGWNICRIAKENWQVHGIIHTSKFSPEFPITSLDLTDFASVKKTFGELKPDAVIHAAAISDANFCQQNPKDSAKINVEATVLQAELCAEKNIPFVFTSSDLVFDGKKGLYSEMDTVNPVSKYGEQKAEAEIKILEKYPRAAICRLPLMVGESGSSQKGYLNEFLKNADAGKQLPLFVDEFRTPIDGRSAAKGLLLAAEKFSGIYHLGGNEKLSRFQIGEIIARVFEIPIELLIPKKQREVKMAAPRPADVSLNSAKARALGFKPSNIEDALDEIAARR